MKYSKKKYCNSKRKTHLSSSLSYKKVNQKRNKFKKKSNIKKTNNSKIESKNSKNKSKKKKKSTKRKNIRKQRKKSYNLSGGGGLMSMLPIPNVFGSGPASSIQPLNDLQSPGNSQSVLVNALCNQYLKNSIKGKSETEYDILLDNLCMNNQVQLNNRGNFGNTNQNMNTQSQPQQKNDIPIPKMFSRVTDGLLTMGKLSSAPLRMGISAVNSGVKAIKNRNNNNNSNNNNADNSNNSNNGNNGNNGNNDNNGNNSNGNNSNNAINNTNIISTAPGPSTINGDKNKNIISSDTGTGSGNALVNTSINSTTNKSQNSAVDTANLESVPVSKDLKTLIDNNSIPQHIKDTIIHNNNNIQKIQSVKRFLGKSEQDNIDQIKAI